MIRFLSLFSIFVSFAAQIALGQSAVEAQSGEHPTFSRIVFPLPEDVTWSVVREDNKVDIAFEPFEGALETSGVMAKLSSGRVTGVETGSGVLSLDLGCACEVEVFRFDGRFVVIDVVQSDEVVPTNIEVPVEETAQAQPRNGPTLGPQSFDINNVARYAANSRFPVPDIASEQTEADPTNIPFSEDGLARHLADAVSSRLLNPSGALASDEGVTETQELPQVTFTTPFRTQPVARGPDVCALPEDLDIARWPAHGNYLRELGGLRREIYDDTGEAPSDRTQALAVAYIALGFGAEARAALSLSGDLDSLFGDLAHVVDGVPTSPDSRLRKTYDCPNSMAFWAVLAGGALPSTANVNETAVEVTLAAMLPEYRQVYADKVIARLNAGGYSDSATRIEGLLARTPEIDRTDEIFFDVSQLEGKTREERLSMLRRAAFSNGPASALALRTLLEEHITARIALDDALLTFAGSFVETVENEADRLAIHAGLLFALVLSEYPFEAIQSYERLAAQEPDFAPQQLDRLIVVATETIADDDYALFIFGLGEATSSQEIAPETILEVANRMVDVGMPSKALEVLARGDLDTFEEKRLISAKAMLALGNPEAALAGLGSLNTSNAKALKARAYLKLKDYENAFANLESDDPLRGQVGWVAQKTQASALQPDNRKALLDHVSGSSAGEALDPSSETTSEVLTQAAEMRTTISALMAN